MQYAVSDESGSEDDNKASPTIKLAVPVIPYDHFERLRSYRCGMTYSGYCDMLKDNLLGGQQSSDVIFHRQKTILYSQLKLVLPVWDLIRSEKVRLILHWRRWVAFLGLLCALDI